MPDLSAQVHYHAMSGSIGTIAGREAELESVRAFLEDVVSMPGILLIEGPAGIGKSTLWEAGVEISASLGHRVLACRPSGAEIELAFASLGDLLESVPGEIVESLPPPQQNALRSALFTEEPLHDFSQSAIAVAFLNVVRTLEFDAPLIVAVDDVDWLDRETVNILTFAFRRLGRRRVGILIARRSELPEPPPLSLDRALPPEKLGRIRLGPVTVGAVHFMLHSKLGLVLTRPKLRLLHDLSGGNPFYALELGRAFLEGAIALNTNDELPPRLSELSSRYLAGLPEKTRTALAAAAALSRPSTSLIEPDALVAGVEAGIIRVDEREIRFTHPLYRAAAYAQLTPEKKRDVHRDLAKKVPDLEERARHLAIASTEPEEDLAALLEEAASRAYRRGAPNTAADLSAHAVRLTPGENAHEQARRTRAEAEYRFQAGDPSAAAALLEKTLERWPHDPIRPSMLSLLARVQHFADDVGAGVETLNRALREAGDDPRLIATIEEGLAWGMLLMREDVKQAASHARAAVNFAEQTDDTTSLAEALAAQALTEFVLGLDSNVAMERALDLERSMTHLRVLRHPSFAHAYILSKSDQFDRARSVLQNLLTRAEDQGDESSVGPLNAHLALIECLEGNWSSARRFIDEGYAAAQLSGQKPTQAFLLSVGTLLAACLGDADEARESGDRALTIAGSDDPKNALARGGEVALWALGLLELSLENFEEARLRLGPVTRLLLDSGIGEPGEVRSLPDLAETLIALGELEGAEELIERYQQMATSTSRASAVAAAARCRGLLLAARGDVAGAIPELTRACQSDLPLERGRGMLSLGMAQRRLKERRAARESLESAHRIFEKLGASVFAARAERELARIGGRRGAGGRLSETELRLARLVAEGRSNKEVADLLFVTPKTVETQLSRIYRKLDIRSRAELMRRVLEGKL